MCFRRGVKALSILHDRNVSNIVGFIEGTEVPLVIVMEYIDGPNLKTLVDSAQCSEIHDILEIAEKISKIIMNAHALPERVLHRDLRPTNIMFRDYYRTKEYDVVILDFDFAWYNGALEDSILRNPVGFLAPEQIQNKNKTSSRSTLTDSYSLGMIFYYMISGVEPLFACHLNVDWKENLKKMCLSRIRSKWTSIGFRFQRLIENLTHDNQYERWDISQANYEIKRLLDAENNETSSFSELVAEELMARILKSLDYRCKENEFVHYYSNGITLHISHSEVKKKIGFQILFLSTGNERYSSLKQYLPSKRDKTISLLRKTGWKILYEDHNSESFSVQGEISISEMMNNFDNIVKGLSEIKYDYNFF
jgi:serine/threonine protein kinase